MSKSIYIPYFYIIQHINSDKYYAGVKYAENANPDQLLQFNGYKTSSKIVKQIILEEGLESFIIRKIKIFETGEEALAYESRFLRRVGAAFNDSFLNRSNNSLNTLNTDYEKRKQTCIDKFGVENPMQSEEIQEKSKQTCLEKFGVDNPSQSPEIKDKKKQTCLENHGVSHPMQSEEVKEKSKKTCIEKYGVEYVSQAKEIQDKMKQTNLVNFGVENAFQSEEIKEKRKQTLLRNFGVEHPMQSPEIQEKRKQTNLVNFGVENPMQSEEIQDKMKQTCLINLGVEYPMQSEEVKEKSKQSRNNLINRPIVLEIRKYKDKFKFKLGPSWFVKKQEVLDSILEELRITYGELECL